MPKKEDANLLADGAGKQQADDARVTMTLALSASDKLKLKTAAAKQGKTVARLVHEWIETLE